MAAHLPTNPFVGKRSAFFPAWRERSAAMSGCCVPFGVALVASLKSTPQALSLVSGTSALGRLRPFQSQTDSNLLLLVSRVKPKHNRLYRSGAGGRARIMENVVKTADLWE
jgi:hypothetical protein